MHQLKHFIKICEKDKYSHDSNTPKEAISTPYSGNIEKQTMQNKNYRDTLFTGKHSQLVLMNLKPRRNLSMPSRWEHGSRRSELES